MAMDDIANFVYQATTEAIAEASSEKKIREILDKHRNKAHFIALKYRIIGGILQSLNIKFGNVLQRILMLVIESKGGEVDKDLILKKTKLHINPASRKLIDDYIALRKQKKSVSPEELMEEFSNLTNQIFNIQVGSDGQKDRYDYDIDLLFRSPATGQLVYVELKYNDDHDTGKFDSINEKMLRTWAGLVHHFRETIKSKDDLVPVLYYFNDSQRYSSYLPKRYVLRGPELFERFFDDRTAYDSLTAALAKISNESTYWEHLDDILRSILELKDKDFDWSNVDEIMKLILGKEGKAQYQKRLLP